MYLFEVKSEGVLDAAIRADVLFVFPLYGTSFYQSVDSKKIVVREITMVWGLFLAAGF